MIKPLIVGLGYKKGSGKNTVAKFLSTHLKCTTKLKVKEASFAFKLKDIAYQLYGWAGVKRPVYYESHREEKEVILDSMGKSPRQIWIELGNYLRAIYPATWINYVINDIKNEDIILITDVGFVNECKAIKEKNGYIVKISRPNQELGTDSRETELDGYENFDLQIINDSTLDNLYARTLETWEIIKTNAGL